MTLKVKMSLSWFSSSGFLSKGLEARETPKQKTQKRETPAMVLYARYNYFISKKRVKMKEGRQRRSHF